MGALGRPELPPLSLKGLGDPGRLRRPLLRLLATAVLPSWLLRALWVALQTLSSAWTCDLLPGSTGSGSQTLVRACFPCQRRTGLVQ